MSRNVEVETDTQLLGTVFGETVWDWRAETIQSLVTPYLQETAQAIGTDSLEACLYIEAQEWELRVQVAKIYDAFWSGCV